MQLIRRRDVSPFHKRLADRISKSHVALHPSYGPHGITRCTIPMTLTTGWLQVTNVLVF